MKFSHYANKNFTVAKGISKNIYFVKKEIKKKKKK